MPHPPAQQNQNQNQQRQQQQQQAPPAHGAHAQPRSACRDAWRVVPPHAPHPGLGHRRICAYPYGHAGTRSPGAALRRQRHIRRASESEARARGARQRRRVASASGCAEHALARLGRDGTQLVSALAYLHRGGGGEGRGSPQAGRGGRAGRVRACIPHRASRGKQRGWLGAPRKRTCRCRVVRLCQSPHVAGPLCTVNLYIPVYLTAL